MQSVEAAKECGMAVVVVAGRKPVYELKAADLVVKDLGELRLINLQQLFRNEDLVSAQVNYFHVNCPECPSDILLRLITCT